MQRVDEMDRRSNEGLKKDIKKLISRVNKKFKLKTALLFGSRARDDWLLTSDVDILLVSNDFKKLSMIQRISKVLEFWSAPVDLEPICYSEDEFERMKKRIGIVRRAVKEGKELLSA